MSDVVVTIPKGTWNSWLEEGCLPGQKCPSGVRYFIRTNGRPKIEVGERVYIVAHGKLRGYSPLYHLYEELPLLDSRRSRLLSEVHQSDIIDKWQDEHVEGRHFYLARQGGAVAVTIPRPIPGFQGFRYRWWDRSEEVPFLDFQIP